MERGKFEAVVDFEDALGRLANEVETHGDVDQASAPTAAQGKYALKITFVGTGLTVYAAQFGATDRSEWSLRMYFAFAGSISGLDADSIYFIGALADATFTNAAIMAILTDGSGDPYVFQFLDSGGLTCYDATSGPIPGNIHIPLEMYWKKAVAGKLEGRFNFIPFDNQGAGDNSSMENIGSIKLLGSIDNGQTNYPSAGEWFVYDSVVVDERSTWIGEYAIPWDRRHM
jgi:hypothetical protein